MLATIKKVCVSSEPLNLSAESTSVRYKCMVNEEEEEQEVADFDSDASVYGSSQEGDRNFTDDDDDNDDVLFIDDFDQP